jgi:hypothetical protein
MARFGFGNLLSNWSESDLAAHHKLSAALRNTWIKAARLQSCCGNGGEPGC